MTNNTSPLDTLEQHFNEIIEAMDDPFDSHDFITLLSSRYRQLYSQALAQYNDQPDPFRALNAQLARRLAASRYHHLVRQQNRKDDSRNILGNDSPAEQWRKVDSE